MVAVAVAVRAKGTLELLLLVAMAAELGLVAVVAEATTAAPAVATLATVVLVVLVWLTIVFCHLNLYMLECRVVKVEGEAAEGEVLDMVALIPEVVVVEDRVPLESVRFCLDTEMEMEVMVGLVQADQMAQLQQHEARVAPEVLAATAVEHQDYV